MLQVKRSRCSSECKTRGSQVRRAQVRQRCDECRNRRKQVSSDWAKRARVCCPWRGSGQRGREATGRRRVGAVDRVNCSERGGEGGHVRSGE